MRASFACRLWGARYACRRCWWTRYYLGSTVCVLCWAGWKRPGIFLEVYRIGEARQVMNLTSLKLLQFAFLQNSRNSDRRANFYETNFAFLDIRKHSSTVETMLTWLSSRLHCLLSIFWSRDTVSELIMSEKNREVFGNFSDIKVPNWWTVPV